MSAKGLTREVIVSEAVACMEHTGQPTVSLHELARRLGVKTPSLYNHIQNTRQLQREESPIQRLHDKDQKRKEFYELYTGTQWGQADNYDLCLDSGRLGIEPCVDMIAALYQQRCSKATTT